jgi:DNA polymerase-1
MGGDWSQQEVRALAYFTQEPTLLEAYATGRDIYASMASEVYNKPYEECGDGTFERKAMKVGVLSCMYGTGPATLAQQLGITRPEADAFIEDFFKRLPMVQAWIDGNKRYAARHGFVWMDGEQRKRRLPDAKKRVRGYDRDKSRAERQATNAIIQGSSAIQTKVTLIALHDLCKRKGWQLWATVHDEVLLVVPEDITDAEVSEFERVMLESYPFGEVPNKTDIELGRCWGEMKSRKEWFA